MAKQTSESTFADPVELIRSLDLTAIDQQIAMLEAKIEEKRKAVDSLRAAHRFKTILIDGQPLRCNPISEFPSDAVCGQPQSANPFRH